MCWQEEGEKRGSGSLGNGPARGAVDSEHGASKSRCLQLRTKSHHSSKRFVYILKYSKNATHAIIDNTCLI
jgi:hypothetical protein